jgi:hypothetical protein
MSRHWLGLLLLVVWIGGSGAAHAALTANPTSIPLGTVTVGQSTTGTTTLTATAGGDVTIQTFDLSAAGCGEFQITTATPLTILKGFSTTVTVKLTPTSAGAKSCTIAVKDSGGVTLITFDGTGTAIAAVLSLNPSSLPTFPNTGVRSTSTSQTLTAINTGGAVLVISNAALTTGTADYIVLTGVTGTTLNPGQSTSWDIACKPSTLGSRPGNFQITSNSSTGGTTNVPLFCTGEEGIITTIPTSHDFGGVAVGTSVPFNFTLKNTGNVTITNLTGALADTTKGYTFNPATVPTSLAANATAALTVTFTPQSGNDGGPVNLTFNALWGANNTPTTATLALNGDGSAASFTITPSPLDFASFRFDSQPQQTYHIQNNGELNVSIDTASFTPDVGTMATEFTFTIKKGASIVALSQILSPGQQLDVTVTAKPNNRTGHIGGKVTVHSSTTGTTDQQLTITGTATAATVLATPMLDFGPVDIDGAPPTQILTIQNTGDGPLDILSFAMMNANPAFTFTLPSPATQLAPNATVDIPVTYTQTIERAPGNFDTTALAANLTGVLNGPAQAMLMVRGRGIDRHLVVNDTQDFPPTFLNPGSAAPTLTITVSNSGEAMLRITALMITGDPVWQLVDTSPVDIPGGGSHDFVVKFVPTSVASFQGELTLVNNDNDKPMAVVKLTGDSIFVHAHGTGGCDAGGASAGGGSALALGVLAVFRVFGRRRRRHAALRIATTAVVATIAIAPAARADGIGISVFEPMAATTGTGFQLQSPEVGANGSWAASTILSYASHPLVLDVFTGSEALHDTPITRSTLLQLGGAYAFLGRFEAGATIPLYMQRGDPLNPMSSFVVKPASGTATGNLMLHAKVRLWRGDGGLGTFVTGTSVVVEIPTATKDQFTGSDKPAARLLLLVAFTPAALRSRVSVSANAGAIVRGKSAYADMVQQSGIAWGAGASVRVLDALWATAEIFGDFTPSGQRQQASAGAMPPATVLSQIEWLAGVSYKMDRRFTIGLAAGRGVTDGPGTPDLRGVLSLAFVPHAAPIAPIHPYEAPRPDSDADGDGIIDRLDRCPHEPEDKDGFQDADGCPDPDNDHDGIPDALDKCPNEPEDKDGFQDADGCSDRDNDGDGIPDALDKCPNQPETINGKEDADGCPDTADATSVAAPDEGSPTKAAEATFARGRELMKQGNYAAACAEFEQSQRLDPEFGTQYNLAGCYEKTGKLATAWNLYRELARSDTNATRRAKAVGLAGSLAHRVPKLKLVLPKKPEGVQVSMNGANANALIGIEIPVDLGSYALVVGATGYRAWRKTVDITEESKVVTVVIDLQPVP